MRRFAIEYVLITLVSTLKLTYGYTNSTSASTCRTYESVSTSKWCRDSTSVDYGYACSTSETTGYCGGYASLRGSNDTFYLPKNSKKLLCPTDQTNGNTQTANLNTVGANITFNSNTLGASNEGWYRFTPTSDKIYSINIKMKFLTQATAEVYFETSTNNFEYKGSAASESSLEVTIRYYSPVWVLIIPSASGGYATVYAEAKAESNSGSNLVGTIVGTAIGVGACLGVVGGVIVGCVYAHKHKKVPKGTLTVRETVYSTQV